MMEETMNENRDARSLYRSPLAGRYASEDMLDIFSERTRITTWRLLWISLAEAQSELGLDIKPEQIRRMRDALDEIDFEHAESLEKETRHDVMAHIKAFAAVCPSAGGVIHLGATSCFVTDNTDLILMRNACRIVRGRLVNLIQHLAQFAREYKDAPTLAYTHFQPAQLTTIGKRAVLWLQDLVMDLEDLETFVDRLALRGVKGTTGTQASYLKLFDGDHDKVEELDRKVCRKMGFKSAFPVTGQTYPRKVDARLLSVLAGIATSASKFAVDLRLLAHERELEEPFLETQVGSSAMAYKRNPMRSERISSLSRFLISLLDNPYHVAANQWLERTLDDSAGRRIVIPEAFLAADSILNLYLSIVKGLTVNMNIVKANMREEISFMATENILMEAVKSGGDRQALHEKIRKHAMKSIHRMKETGKVDDLLKRMRSDKDFAVVMEEIERFLDPKAFIGRSVEQVEMYLHAVVEPLVLERNDLLEDGAEEIRF
jgi:adenylosuccinate lyase